MDTSGVFIFVGVMFLWVACALAAGNPKKKNEAETIQKEGKKNV